MKSRSLWQICILILRGGVFESEEDKDKYLRLNDARQYLDSQQGMLVPFDSVTTLVKEVAQSISKANREPLETKISRVMNERQASIRQQFYTPKISLGIISTFLVYLFLSPQVLLEHPYLSPFFMSKFAPLIWGFSIYVLGVLWFFTWSREYRLKNITRMLFSLDNHRMVLRDIYKHKPKFTRSELREFLKVEIIGSNSSSFFPRDRLYDPSFFRQKLDPTILDEATDLAIGRYLERGWIRRAKGETIDDWFEVNI